MNDQIMSMLNELRPEFDFTDSDDFVMDGLLDFFDIISLVSMLEETYECKIDGLDIVPENFSSIDFIMALVKKCGGKES